MEHYESNTETIDSYLERMVLVLRQISHISSIYSRYLHKHFNVTNSQLLCLRALSKEDGLSAGEIGRRVFIKPGTITGILDRLEAKGLVERTRVNKDRRIVNISITNAGRELVQAAPVPIQSTLAINLKKLPLDEVEAITSTAERLLELMKIEDVATEVQETVLDGSQLFEPAPQDEVMDAIVEKEKGNNRQLG